MRRWILFLIVLSLLLLSGCWDYREVDQLATAYAVGIDRIPGNKPILLTVQLVTPVEEKSDTGGGNGGGGLSSQPYTIMSSKGESLFAAICALCTQSPRRVYFAHNKVIVLGQELAASGIGDILDELDRNGEFRRNSWMLVADRPAAQILGKSIALEQLPGKGLEDILREFRNVSYSPPVNRSEFYAQLQSDTGVSYAPLVKIVKSAARQLDIGKPTIVTISDTAIFKNLRMVGTLDSLESKNLMWLLDEPKGGTVQLPNGPSGQKGEIFLYFLSRSTTITPVLSEDGITMEIHCTGSATLKEAEPAGLKLGDPNVVKQLEQQADAVLKARIERTVAKAQNLNADFVGFADKLNDSYPAEWKRVKPNWDQVFPNIKVEVACQIKIVSFGMINDSASIK